MLLSIAFRKNALYCTELLHYSVQREGWDGQMGNLYWKPLLSISPKQNYNSLKQYSLRDAFQCFENKNHNSNGFCSLHKHPPYSLGKIHYKCSTYFPQNHLSSVNLLLILSIHFSTWNRRDRCTKDTKFKWHIVYYTGPKLPSLSANQVCAGQVRFSLLRLFMYIILIYCI